MAATFAAPVPVTKSAGVFSVVAGKPASTLLLLDALLALLVPLPVFVLLTLLVLLPVLVLLTLLALLPVFVLLLVLLALLDELATLPDELPMVLEELPVPVDVMLVCGDVALVVSLLDFEDDVLLFDEAVFVLPELLLRPASDPVEVATLEQRIINIPATTATGEARRIHCLGMGKLLRERLTLSTKAMETTPTSPGSRRGYCLLGLRPVNCDVAASIARRAVAMVGLMAWLSRAYRHALPKVFCPPVS
jgi:hypothetical protein